MRQCPYAPIYCDKNEAECEWCLIYINLYLYGIQQIVDKLEKGENEKGYQELPS